jgi:hypothetical protein
MAKRLNFADESYELRSLPADAKRLVNLYAEKLPDDARSQVIVRSTPGLTPAYEFGTGPIWAMNDALSGRLYVVSGTHFIRVRPDAESPPEDLGDVGGAAPNTFPTIAVGTVSVCVCVPPRAYVADHSGAMTQITDPAFTQFGASSVAYIDGYFVFTAQENSSRWFCSDLLSGTTFSALNFAYADTRPNVVRRVISHRGDLWFMGEGGLEAWYDAGGKNFPFLRRAGSDIAYGCGAPNAIAIIDNSIFWLSYYGIVFRLNGYQAVRVSTFAVEAWIRDFADLGNVDACAHQYEGHAFVCFSFTGANKKTLVYDCAMERWHERASSAGGTGYWLGRTAAQRGPVVLIGDRLSGRIYTFDPAADNDNGQVLTRIAVLPPLWAETDRAYMHRLTLEMQPGIMPKDNRITLEVSDDGGTTYRVRPDGVTSGVLNDTKHRVYWTRLGSFRQRAIRFQMDGPCALYGADAEMDKGVS